MEEKSEIKSRKVMAQLLKGGAGYILSFMIGMLVAMIFSTVMDIYAAREFRAEVEAAEGQWRKQRLAIERIENGSKRNDEWFKRFNALQAVRARSEDELNEYIEKLEKEDGANDTWLASECGQRVTKAWDRYSEARSEGEKDKYLDVWLQAEEEKEKCKEWKDYQKATKDRQEAERKYSEALEGDKEDYEKAKKALEEVSPDIKPSAP